MTRIIIFLLLLAAFLFMVIYGVYEAFLLGMILLLTPFVSLLICFWAAGKIHTGLTISSRPVQERETAAVMDVSAPFRFLFSSFSCSIGSRKAAPEIHEGGKTRFVFPVTFQHCGKNTLSACHFSFYDPFGIHRFHRTLDSHTVVVLPKEIGNPETALRTLKHMTSSAEKEYYGAVPYKHGDSLHLINWKVSARKEAPYVRDSYPSDSSTIALSADLLKNEKDRDVMGDVLYSCGKAILGKKKSFLFLWRSDQNRPVSRKIHTPEEWDHAVGDFLLHGARNALWEQHVPYQVSVLYITDMKDVKVPPGQKPVIWSVVPSQKAALSGKSALIKAVGGSDHE